LSTSGYPINTPSVRKGRLVDNNSYLSFLLLGTMLVLIDGQIIYRGGRSYLHTAYGNDNVAGSSLARLVAVLFHLAVLGILALISTIDVPADTPLEGVVLRLGIVLLVLAIAHGIAIGALTRMRDREEAQRILHNNHRDARHRDPTGPEPIVTPVPGQSQYSPSLAPPLDDVSRE